MTARRVLILCLLGLFGSVLPVVSAAGDGDALWRVVHDICVPDRRLTGLAAPCVKVDLRRGYAVVKDPESPTQLLVVPTARVTGVEDPKLLDPDAPNYWALAWENRGLLDRRARRPLPRAQIGLVVNSAYGRSQNQLHIHLDCVRADVTDAVAAQLDEIGPDWKALDADLGGRRYLVRWISDADLAAEDPFKLIAHGRDPADMARQTLVLIGAQSPLRGAGFVLLVDQADRETGDTGHGEDLLDHGCSHASAAASD